MLEYWNIGIMGSGLRIVEDSGMAGLLNQNEYDSINVLAIRAYLLGRKQIKEL
jgi:hypothetical protein